VSVYDIGLLRGYGIYEAMTTHNKKPFMFADHLERFKKSAIFLDLKVPFSDAEIEEAVHDLIRANGFKETNIKFILTGGAALGGIDYDRDFPTFYILAEEFSAIPEKYLTDGATLISHEHQRQYPQYKTTNYITAVMLQKTRKEKNALEVLYTSQGKVLECSTSNFFIVKDGKIITAKENVLLGITRKVVIDLARKAGLNVEERDISVQELRSADEAFLTASFKEVVPVVSIDGALVGSGRVGEKTKKVLDLFQKFTASY